MNTKLIAAALLLLPALALAQTPGTEAKDKDLLTASQAAGNSPIPPARNVDISEILDPTAPRALLDARIDLILDGVPLKSALKLLTEQTKIEMTLDPDVSESLKVNVSAKNVHVGTAMEILADQTGLHWNQHSNQKPGVKGQTAVYRLGSKLPDNVYWRGYHPFQWSYNVTPMFYSTPPKLFLLPSGQAPAAPYLKSFSGPAADGTSTLKGGVISDLLKPGSRRNLTNVDEIYNQSFDDAVVSWTSQAEVRSTFTCPHCKQQVTVLHQHKSPKCERCSRVFHDDWKFCPFDGAKRPATAGLDWLFCPLCGKGIKGAAKPEVKAGYGEG